MGGVSIAKKIFRSPTPPAPAPAPAVVAPTVAEVSQSEATSADGYDARKTKAKGRSQSIISGSQGVTGIASNYSLGKKSLLGQV